ncbi:uncharacterized protein LOC129599542 [Paramacrobiotus metropolitanus]|uniref:uncharacterized protein LOC129599542 n=1 Tax=Paramacrobiotus metropolitanus TaxID=2943436 RepID=UPI00244618A0|nr:uncharacterized protein LOC129599542 [Paramacrobiotus metropolitanus]XP_055353795.1 uncharacterized protein LOC129599542 [Paramacrobiotus metropolitanus]XP_055353796.1 uncharacterized protein LOC129599542 [Paramacrobiotus metropolitanus]XP_055353797.1 uncharacterized protein LOC129599542 [Paramacrobiotus metropolitanus]
MELEYSPDMAFSNDTYDYDQGNFLVDLPWEVQHNIFKRLDPKSRASLREVSKDLRNTMDDPSFWKRQIVRLSSIRRFKEPMWNLLLQRNIRHIEVRPSADETQEYHRHNMVWNDLEWGQLAERIPDLKSITTPLKCDKGKGLPCGMRDLDQLEQLRVHSVLYADHQLFMDMSCLSTLKQLCIEVLCLDVLVERTDALKHLAQLRDLEDLQLTFRRFTMLNKQAFQYLLYHLPKLRRFALRRCCFRFPDISVIFSSPPPSDDVKQKTGTVDGSEINNHADNAAVEPERINRLNLTELDLSGTLQHVLNEDAVTALDTLQIFRLQTHGIDDSIREFFRSCFTKWQRLVELDVRNADLPADIFHYVPHSLRIVHLSLSGIDFSLEALLKLSERCGTHMEQLHLYGCEPKHPQKLYYLPDWFPNLKCLSFVGDIGSISREILCRLSEMKLDILDVRECQVQPGKDVWDILRSLMGSRTHILS